MPTVLRIEDFAFRFYSDEHEPPHIHCRNADGVAVIEIETGNVLRTNGKIRDPDVRKAQALVREHRKLLLTAWLKFALKKTR